MKFKVGDVITVNKSNCFKYGIIDELHDDSIIVRIYCSNAKCKYEKICHNHEKWTVDLLRFRDEIKKVTDRHILDKIMIDLL